MSGDKGVVEILTNEIGVPFDAGMERPEVLFAYLRRLLNVHEHDMEVRKVIGRPHSANAERFTKRVRQLCDGNLSREESIQECSIIADAMREAWDDESEPVDRDMEFLSGVLCAIRFGLEMPCRSRWPAEVGGNLFKRHYGMTLFDSNTRRWSAEWLRDRFTEGLSSLANAAESVSKRRDGRGSEAQAERVAPPKS